MSTEKGQEVLEKWRELLEKVRESSPHLEKGVLNELTVLEGLEASIEECKDHYKIRLSCEAKMGYPSLFLDIPYKTDSRKVAFSPGNFFDAVARHLGYEHGQRLEFKIILEKNAETRI